jgi:hypothetical protein
VVAVGELEVALQHHRGCARLAILAVAVGEARLLVLCRDAGAAGGGGAGGGGGDGAGAAAAATAAGGSPRIGESSSRPGRATGGRESSIDASCSATLGGPGGLAPAGGAVGGGSGRSRRGSSGSVLTGPCIHDGGSSPSSTFLGRGAGAGPASTGSSARAWRNSVAEGRRLPGSLSKALRSSSCTCAPPAADRSGAACTWAWRISPTVLPSCGKRPASSR